MNTTQKFDRISVIKIAVLTTFSICQLSLTGFETKPAELPQNLSNSEKIEIIKEIILKNMDRTPDYIDQDAVLEEISQMMNLDKIQVEELQEIEKQRKQKVLQKYPMTDEQLREKYQQEAEDLFPLYNIGDEVEVHYLLHNKSFSVSGVFYRIDSTHIWIGKKKILRLNLPRKYSIRFDADATIILRNNYIDGKIKKYHVIRSEYEKKLTDKSSWIKSGYLFFYGQWVTPRELVEARLKYLNEELRIRRMHLRIAKEKSLVRRITILQQILNMIRLEKLNDHFERVFEIRNQIREFKRRYVEIQIELVKQENDPERARIILQSAISKYPDAINIAAAKTLLQEIESVLDSRRKELQEKIMVHKVERKITEKIIKSVSNHKTKKVNSKVSIKVRKPQTD